jgi:hypothetical protein
LDLASKLDSMDSTARTGDSHSVRGMSFDWAIRLTGRGVCKPQRILRDRALDETTRVRHDGERKVVVSHILQRIRCRGRSEQGKSGMEGLS